MLGLTFILHFYNIALDINLEGHQLLGIIKLSKAFMTNSENGCPFTSLWTLKHLQHLKIHRNLKCFFVINKRTLIDDGFEVKKAPNSTKDHKVDGCDSHAHLPKILIICKDHYGSKTHRV